jgi:hypothetical protein
MTRLGNRVLRDHELAITGPVVPSPNFAQVWTAAFLLMAAGAPV